MMAGQRGESKLAWLLPAPAIFMLAWGGNHFTPLLHLYEQLGNYRPWQANLLLGMYVGGLIPGLMIASGLSDRLGRKPILLGGTLLAVLGSTLLAVGLDNFGLLLAGRALAGLGVGVAMSVGTSWMKELSSPPFDNPADKTSGARRPALTLTLGFGVGAAVTGALGQWGPEPTSTPFIVHGLLSGISLVTLAMAPESLGRDARTTNSLWRDLKIASTSHRRFTRLILPAAPWVFAAAGVAYAVIPSTVQDEIGNWTTLYATILSVVTLGMGAVVQNYVGRINRKTNGGALPVGLTLMTAGMILAVAAAILKNPVIALGVAVVLGAAYGLCVVSGLIHIQSIATPQDLAGLTGVYYALSYTGFLLPTILAALLPIAPYAVTLTIVAGLCFTSLLLVHRESRLIT